MGSEMCIRDRVAPDSLVETLAVFLGATRFLAVTSFGIRGGFEAEGY